MVRTGKRMLKFNLFDVFLILLVLLAGAAAYFSFVQPVEFSHLIKREGVSRYALVEILLPDDLGWMKEVLPAGEAYRNVYGKADWKILEISEETLGGKKITKVKAKLMATEESSGLIRYGKYTLVQGSVIRLINDDYFIEGRVYKVQMLEENFPI